MMLQRLIVSLSFTAVATGVQVRVDAGMPVRPSILWMIAEDLSPDLTVGVDTTALERVIIFDVSVFGHVTCRRSI